MIVVNIREGFDVYGGRPRGGFEPVRGGNDPRKVTPGDEGWLGNPHRVGKCPCGETHGRKEAIRLYKRYFWERVNRDQAFRIEVMGLQGKRVACFCKPQDCHLDIVKAWLDAGCPLRSNHEDPA